MFGCHRGLRLGPGSDPEHTAACITAGPHTHTHTHAVAADGDLYGHRYKRHQFSLFHPPCLQQRTGRVYQLPPQHVRSSRRQPRCRRLKSVSAAPVRSPEQFIQTVPSVLTAEQEEQTPKTKDFSPGLIW